MCHSYLDFSISPFVGKKTPFADLSFFLTIFDDILANKNNESMEKLRAKNVSEDSKSTFRLGVFFILLGLALLVVTYDLFNLGSFMAYITWESVLMFLGVTLLICRSYLAGLICLVGGGWFFLDDIFVVVPSWIKNTYWPGAIILLGFFLIITSLIKKNR